MRRPVQSAPPTEPGSWIVPFVSFGPSPTTDGGVNTGPIPYFLTISIASARSSGVKSIEIVDRHALAIERRRLGRKRLRRRRALAGHRRRRDRPLFDRPHRLAGHAIEHVGERLLRDLDDGLDPAAVDGDVGEDRRRGIVVVEQIVMHRLEVPDALAGASASRQTTLLAYRLSPSRWPPYMSLVGLVVGR